MKILVLRIKGEEFVSNELTKVLESSNDLTVYFNEDKIDKIETNLCSTIDVDGELDIDFICYNLNRRFKMNKSPKHNAILVSGKLSIDSPNITNEIGSLSIVLKEPQSGSDIIDNTLDKLLEK